MSRRKPDSRCPLCQLRLESCLCAEIAKCRTELNVKTQVEVLMHHRESKLPTNTARLAAQILPSCRIHLRGLEGKPLDTQSFLNNLNHTLFLYPSDDSQELTPQLAEKYGPALTLIVPDGSWRQASKVAKREAQLRDLPRVHLLADVPTQYHLRNEPKEGGLATFEAIARALGVIEGKEVRSRLEAIFQQFVERTLKSRGRSLL